MADLRTDLEESAKALDRSREKVRDELVRYQQQTLAAHTRMLENMGKLPTRQEVKDDLAQMEARIATLIKGAHTAP